MFVETYREIDVTSLDDETNTYSLKDHMPLPTIEYIFNQTGIDMRLGVGDDTVDQVLLYITKFTMNTIKSLVPSPTQNMLEFLIAKSSDYRKGFVDTVCAVISTTRGKGLTDFLSNGYMGGQDLPKIVQVTAKANGLLFPYYTEKLTAEMIREDY